MAVAGIHGQPQPESTLIGAKAVLTRVNRDQWLSDGVDQRPLDPQCGAITRPQRPSPPNQERERERTGERGVESPPTAQKRGGVRPEAGVELRASEQNQKHCVLAATPPSGASDIASHRGRFFVKAPLMPAAAVRIRVHAARFQEEQGVTRRLSRLGRSEALVKRPGYLAERSAIDSDPGAP